MAIGLLKHAVYNGHYTTECCNALRFSLELTKYFLVRDGDQFLCRFEAKRFTVEFQGFLLEFSKNWQHP